MNLTEYLIPYGARSKLARTLDVSKTAITHWEKKQKLVPVKTACRIEKLTDGVVTRQELRPDDYFEIWPDLADNDSSSRGVASPGQSD